MEAIIDNLTKIPFVLALVISIVGMVPFFIALKKPPEGALKIGIFGLVYIAGALGAMSVALQCFTLLN